MLKVEQELLWGSMGCWLCPEGSVQQQRVFSHDHVLDSAGDEDTAVCGRGTLHEEHCVVSVY